MRSPCPRFVSRFQGQCSDNARHDWPCYRTGSPRTSLAPLPGDARYDCNFPDPCMAFPAPLLPLRRAYGANAFSPATDYSESQSQSDTLWRARSRQDRFRCCPQFPQRSLRELRATPESDRKSTRLNSSHGYISYAVFCLKKKKNKNNSTTQYYSITLA